MAKVNYTICDDDGDIVGSVELDIDCSGDVTKDTYTAIVNTDILNVRSSPEIANNKIGQLRRGDNVLITEDFVKSGGYTWRQIESGNLKSGWLASDLTFRAANNTSALDVPYYSQVEGSPAPANTNDCGPACVAMLLDYYTEQQQSVYELSNLEPGLTTGSELQKLLARTPNIKSTTDTLTSPDDLEFVYGKIDDGTPIIILITPYSNLNISNNLAGGGNFAHWLTIVGYDDEYIYAHDPLWRLSDRNNSGGAYLPIKIGDFLNSIFWTTDNIVYIYEYKPTPTKHEPPTQYSRKVDGNGHVRVVIDGNNKRKQTGANLVRAAYFSDNGGSVAANDLRQWQANEEQLIKELKRFNDPNWTTSEPVYGHLLRVFAAQAGYSDEQIIANFRRLLHIINQFRSSNGIPYIRLIITLSDSFNAYRSARFDDYAQPDNNYHTAPGGRIGTRFWQEKAYRRRLLPFAKKLIQAVEDYSDLIFGFQVFNEPALDYRASKQDINDYIAGNHEIIREMVAAGGNKYHIMTGLRTWHDIAQGTIDANKFYELLFAGDGKYYNVINNHPYCQRPPIPHLTEEMVFDEWQFMQGDIAAARKYKLPLIATEMGTYHEGYQSGHPLRDEVFDYAAKILLDKYGYWAIMLWQFAVELTYDKGYGDNERGPTTVGYKAFPSTFGILEKWHALNIRNYNMG